MSIFSHDGSCMPLPQESILADQLFEAARVRAKQHRLNLRPSAASQIEQMTKSGVQKILAEAKKKPVQDQDAYIRGAMRVATEAISTLVDDMTSARFRIPGYLATHPDSIGEQT